MPVGNHIKCYFIKSIETIWWPLYILCWNHLMERKHRLWITLWMIIEGCLVFLVLFLARQSLLLSVTPTTILRSNNNTVNEIFYSPYNNFTTNIMKNAMKELNDNPNLDVSWKLQKTYDSYYNIKKMNVSNHNYILVNFVNTDSNFTYSITMFERPSTSEHELMYDGFFRQFQLEETSASPYLGPLQWTIDKSYIRQLEDHNVTQDLILSHKKAYIPKDLAKLQQFIAVCTVLAPLPFFMYKSSQLISLKRSGLQDLIRVSGISTNIHRLSHLFDTVVISIVYAIVITLFLKVSSNPILPYTNSVIIMITIILYFLNLTALAFVTSTLYHGYQHADSLAILVYIWTFMMDFIWHSQESFSVILHDILCCLLTHVPIYAFWNEVEYYESLGQGADFSNIIKIPRWDCIPIITLWFFLLVHMTILMVIDGYLCRVKPGQYGIPQKWNFCFKKSYWRPEGKKNIHQRVQCDDLLRDEKYFETGPKNAEIAIKVVNVRKIFITNTGRNYALNNVSLDVYKGEVIVIIGVNGAGKTTLLNILSGLIAPTTGSVYVQGSDEYHKVHDVPQSVALCPQKDIIFTNLTVKENIWFFEKLNKKRNKIGATDKLIEQLHLYDKKNFFVYQISKGLRRSLQVACTLACNADIIILDEPTSGMDKEARHLIWNLILELRGDKTIIMTTSFLEEANALADRLAVLYKGKLRCYGSPYFLKAALGTGLNLTISLKYDTFLEELYDLVKSIIPHIKYKILDKHCMLFMLPNSDEQLFPQLFDALQAKISDFDITVIDVGMYMEEIFLEFIDGGDTKDMHIGLSHRSLILDRCNGWKLYFYHVSGLIMRIVTYWWLKRYQFLILQILLPIIGFIIVTLTTNYNWGYGHFQRHLGHNYDFTVVYNMGHFRKKALIDTLDDLGLSAIFSEDVEDDINNPYNNITNAAGIIMTNDSTKLIVPVNPWDISRSVNIYSNMYMKLHMPYINKSIITTNEIIPRTKTDLVEPKSMFLTLKWTCWVVFLSSLPIAPLIQSAIIERRTGARDNYIMIGCSPVLFWGTKLLTHSIMYWSIMLGPLSIITMLCDFDNTFQQSQFIGDVVLLLIIFTFAVLPYIYVLSFVFVKDVSVSQVYIISISYGIIIPMFIKVMQSFWVTYSWTKIISGLMLVFAYTSPVYPFSLSLSHLTMQARLNAYCNLNKHLCPNLHIMESSFSSQICCESSSSTPFGYIDMLMSDINTIVMIIHFFIYSIIVILLEKRIIQTFFERIIHMTYKEPEQMFFNYTVQKEKDIIEEWYEKKNFDTDIIITRNLHKKFFHLFKRNEIVNCVRGINFTAEKGECIALLGPPGAGKSTVLRMLAGSIVMTRGDCWVKGFSLRKQRSKYLKKVAVAPNIGGLDPFLTGRQNLMFICRLLGYSKDKAKIIANKSLKSLGLQSYANTQVTKYSLGCRRRLSLCALETIAPEVALIDDPTLNVDPSTKPLIAKALQRMLSANVTVIVSETSLDWSQMEHIYDRIAIISYGQLAAIGPAAQILKEISSGYTVRLKLKIPPVYKIIEEDEEKSKLREEQLKNDYSILRSRVTALKEDFQNMFPTSRLIEEHLCVLYFNIKDTDNTMLYSEMFIKLQEVKKKYSDLVKHYTLCATSLDDVFWRFKHVIDYL